MHPVVFPIALGSTPQGTSLSPLEFVLSAEQVAPQPDEAGVALDVSAADGGGARPVPRRASVRGAVGRGIARGGQLQLGAPAHRRRVPVSPAVAHSPSVPSVRCGAVLVLRPPCFVLVGEETAPSRRGQVATAAGKCEGSETPLQCAVREAAEEFRCVVDAGRCTWVFAFDFHYDGRPYSVDVFSVLYQHVIWAPDLRGHHPLARLRFLSIPQLASLCGSPRADVAEVLRRAVRHELF